jgi:glycosyltransferase involved in cell wall biosynthesis
VITVAAPLETSQSAGWVGHPAAIAVVVSTHGRAGYLTGLLDALDAQQGVNAEYVIADNGSQDETWSLLVEWCRRTSLRALAMRLPFHDGPGVPRNTCIDAARAPLIAFTDDDCLPAPGWLQALTSGFDDATAIVQGRTLPVAGEWGGPWGRTLEITRASGLYETANLAARRSAIVAAGGFGVERLLSGRAFGEDVLLGAKIARSGGFRFEADALVHHRVLSGKYADFVRERQRLAGFPLLLREVPELRQRAFCRVFLGRRRALTDLGLAGIVVAIAVSASGEPAGLVAVVAALPWAGRLWAEAGNHPGAPRLVRVIQLMAADIIGFGALVGGSLRARRLLL